MQNHIPVERLNALTAAAASVVGATELEPLLGRLVETACETIGARYGALGVIGDHGTLVEFVHRGIDAATAERIGHLPQGRGVLGTLIRERAAIRLRRIADHPDSVGFPTHHPPMETFLGVPVTAGADAFGNLYLTEKSGGFTAEDELVMGALANIAGAAIETARLRGRLETLAVIEDRERIGRDLHDSVIQDLFGTGLELQALAAEAEPDVSERIIQAVDRVDSTIDTLRQIVAGLHARRDTSTFERDLRAHVVRLADPYDTVVTIRLRPDDLDIDRELSAELIPVIGEAVSNALRHSQSPTVAVTVESLGDRLVLSVADSGEGFDPASVPRGMGLDNLERRSRRLGGELSIRSVIGAGTIVEVLLPVG